MEFPIAKWTRWDFKAPEVVQRVDVSVSDLAEVAAGADASDQFKKHPHEAFNEVKWCTKGWGPKSRELNSRRKSTPEDLRKLANHIKRRRCVVAAMIVFDDEDRPQNTFSPVPAANVKRTRFGIAQSRTPNYPDARDR